MYFKFTDAQTGDPIEGATILLWDLHTLEKPRLGRGIYFTDQKGECNISGSYVAPGHIYRMYAFKANFSAETAEYVPATFDFTFPLFASSYNRTSILLPGALIVLKGSIYSFQASSIGTRFLVTVIDPETQSPPPLATSYLTKYDSISEWFMGSSPRYVIVPAGVPIKLKAETFFYAREGFNRISYTLDEEGKPFNLTKGSRIVLDLSWLSLMGSIGTIKERLKDVMKSTDEARRIGFVVFEEKDSLKKAQLMIDEDARLYLNNGEYNKSWVALRTAFMTMNLVIRSLYNMRLISMTNAVYLPAVLSVFAVIMAFFLFEKSRKKVISSAAIYAVFLIIFYLTYPGAYLIIKENALLFLASVMASFTATLAAVFVVPRVWRERQIEGEVSLRSAVSIIFSMGKRQIRRKRIRGFFTIFSMILLILAFTSLTSFGAAYGIVSKRVDVNPLYEGILLKRLINETETSSLPLDFNDLNVLSEAFRIRYVAPRVENWPASNPLATLIDPATNKSVPLYGILGIDPSKEPLSTHLKDFTVGRYLNEVESDEILLSTNLAKALGVDVNKNIHLYISGVSGLIGNFTIKGLFGDESYMSLIDIDGQPFGPSRFLSDGSLRTCNSTEVIIMNWRTFVKLQETANALMEGKAPSFAMLSEIVFQPVDWAELDSMVNMLVLVFDYNVFVSFNNAISHYFIGTFVEAKGVVELLFPLVMAALNVGAVMLNAIYERRKEIGVLSMVGLNPAHIAATFVAEAIVIGMVGGGLGYLFGLGFFRIMTLFEQDIMVREKLEWWWSAIAFAIALAASVLSAIRPAMLAVSLYTPSKVRKLKISEEERETRKEALFKAFQSRELSMPVKVKTNEFLFFYNYILSRLDELSTGFLERIEGIEELAEIENVKGELVKTIKFDYILGVSGERRGTKNELIGVKSPEEDYYRIKLVCAPARPGTPITMIDRTIDFVHGLVMEWTKNKKMIIGTS